MDAAEVVVHVVKADCRHVVLDLLGERVGEACEPAHAHPHREVLPLNVGRAHKVFNGFTDDWHLLDAGHFRRAVAACWGAGRCRTA